MEEDIELLEMDLDDIVCYLGQQVSFEYGQQVGKAIENLLKRYKELEEMLKHRIKYTRELEQDLFENARNYVIPISVIQNKIDEINEEIKHEDNEKVIIWLHKQRKVLQELLEERNK